MEDVGRCQYDEDVALRLLTVEKVRDRTVSTDGFSFAQQEHLARRRPENVRDEPPQTVHGLLSGSHFDHFYQFVFVRTVFFANFDFVFFSVLVPIEFTSDSLLLKCTRMIFGQGDGD
jgi:hypothetical protein